MSRADFLKEINNSKSYNDILDAYVGMLSLNIKMACHTLEKVNVIEKEFENDELSSIVLKVHFGNYMNYNCGLVIHKKEQLLTNECITDLENLIEYRLHISFIINEKSLIIYDNINKCVIKECSYKTKVYSIIEENIQSSLSSLFEEEREARKLSNKTSKDKIGYEINKIYNMDCIEGMKKMGNASVDFVLTDIPYDEVSQFDSSEGRVDSEALQVINKGLADKLTFDLRSFLSEIHRITSNSCCVFCGYEQVSDIVKYFRSQNCTTRVIVWEKSQFSPMNGDIIYGSNIELAVWAKKHGNGVFNAFCKGNVFKHGAGIRDIHPTQKNVKLFEELIIDNTNAGGIVFDPCMGSGTTAEACLNNNRSFIGFEVDTEFCIKANTRVQKILMPGTY